jgi:hypothetical protein
VHVPLCRLQREGRQSLAHHFLTTPMTEPRECGRRERGSSTKRVSRSHVLTA